MADIIISNIDEALVMALDERAAAAGMRRDAWLREQLAALATGSIVRHTYVLRAFDNRPERVGTLHLTRRNDGTIDITNSYVSTPAQRGAVQVVKELMTRNEPGDRESAIQLLKEQFEQVFETSV